MHFDTVQPNRLSPLGKLLKLVSDVFTLMDFLSSLENLTWDLWAVGINDPVFTLYSALY